MTSIRPPAVAGSFYPADAGELKTLVQSLLHEVKGVSGRGPKAIIVPHAGYIYSGPIAAVAYAHVAAAADSIRRVVLLGPAHRLGFHGLALSSADFFSTPLGPIPLDLPAIEALEALADVQVLDKAHAAEHSLEVQLPFLQEVLHDFTLVPIVVGDATANAVARVIELMWGGPETLIVISSDLSHYQDYPTAQKQDLATSQAIVSLQPESISYHDACGRIPVSGLLVVAKKLGLTVTRYDLRNSGDTAGDRSRVVGYGAYGLSECQHQQLSRKGQIILLELARTSIRHGLQHGCPGKVDLEGLEAELMAIRASFVTLEKNGHLRGCIGSLEAWRPLAVDVAENAYAAAFRDRRFPPMQEDEVDALGIHLSLLTPAVPMAFSSEEDLLKQLQPGIDGLILQEGQYRGTFLPSVWAELPTPALFLSQLKRKAGLPVDYWSPTVRILRYTTEMVE